MERVAQLVKLNIKRMLKNLLYYTIIAILLIGVYGTFGLVWEEIQTGNGCPKILTIPACVIILICFLVPLIAHLLKKYTLFFFVFTGIGCTIASIASIMQYTSNGSCPKLSGGTPMCYLSFIIFSTLIILKIINLKTQK